jgi:hypothetical protein
MCILNFTKIRWKITELLGSKVLAETPCINMVIMNITDMLNTAKSQQNRFTFPDSLIL